MSKQGEKLGDLAEDAVDELMASRKVGRVASFLWRNAFPMICGLIVTASVAWVTEMSQDHADASRDFVYFQLETDHKFRQVEGALQMVAAENVALRKLLQKQQVELGLTGFKVKWLHSSDVFVGPPDPGAGPGDPGPQVPRAPRGELDFDKLARELERRLAVRSKVDPDDIERILRKKGALYQQRQMPNLAPAGGR